MSGIKLGQTHQYVDRYDVSLLEPIPRSLSRSTLDLNDKPFFGWDYWQAFELSWLNSSGVPRVAIAEFGFSCDSKYIIESKSFKYYLNSFNQTKFESKETLRSQLEADLASACEGIVEVKIFDLDGSEPSISQLSGICIDHLECEINAYQPDAQILKLDDENEVFVENECLYSHLLKSNCPVTGQPDWATVSVVYSGSKISRPSLLKYIVSFRQYQGFHESCVERIYSDIQSRCAPRDLNVFARYTRRGGLDINPFRCSDLAMAATKPFGRTLRQ